MSVTRRWQLHRRLPLSEHCNATTISLTGLTHRCLSSFSTKAMPLFICIHWDYLLIAWFWTKLWDWTYSLRLPQFSSKIKSTTAFQVWTSLIYKQMTCLYYWRMLVSHLKIHGILTHGQFILVEKRIWLSCPYQSLTKSWTLRRWNRRLAFWDILQKSMIKTDALHPQPIISIIIQWVSRFFTMTTHRVGCR